MSSKKTVAIDFDGVLAQYHGWVSEDHTEPPVAGAREFVEGLLREGFDIAIYTTRPSKIILDWLDRHGFSVRSFDPPRAHGHIWVSESKPKALVYIDDRAFRFIGDWEAAKKAIREEPWWQEEKGGEEVSRPAPRSYPRFISCVAPPNVLEDGESRWYFDTHRPLDGDQPYTKIEVGADKNPNNYKKVLGPMALLFTDQAEYYAVCWSCFSVYHHMQWTGSTGAGLGWRETAQGYLEKHQKEKGWCEFCDPVFGNGGWARRDY